MAKKINYRKALAESLNGGTEIIYSTYGMPEVVFVKSIRKDGTESAGWLSVNYVKKVRRMAGLAAQFEDSKSQNA